MKLLVSMGPAISVFMAYRQRRKVTKENHDYTRVWTSMAYTSSPTHGLFVISESLEGSDWKTYTIFLHQPSSAGCCIPSLHAIPLETQRHLHWCACQGGSTTPEVVLLRMMPVQPFWPSATCSHLTLLVLAWLFLTKPPLRPHGK